jgi:hypothetical protein
MIPGDHVRLAKGHVLHNRGTRGLYARLGGSPYGLPCAHGIVQARGLYLVRAV